MSLNFSFAAMTTVCETSICAARHEQSQFRNSGKEPVLKTMSTTVLFLLTLFIFSHTGGSTLQWRFSGVTVVLQWFYGGVTMVSKLR
jgi:hypothetical protein